MFGKTSCELDGAEEPFCNEIVEPGDVGAQGAKLEISVSSPSGGKPPGAASPAAGLLRSTSGQGVCHAWAWRGRVRRRA